MAKLAHATEVSGDYSKCYQLNDPYYSMLSVCVETQPKELVPNTDEINECMKHELFCGICCPFYIGNNDADKEFIAICTSKCKKSLKASPWN